MNQRHCMVTIFIVMTAMLMTGQIAKCAELSGELMFHGVYPTGELDRRFDDTFSGGVGLTYMYAEHVGVNASMNYLSLSRNRDGSDFAVWHINLNGEIAYPFLNRFRAYILGGMGIYVWNTDRAWWTDYNSKDGANLGFNYGMGLNYRLGSSIDALAQFNRHGVELTDRDSRVYWNELSLGIRVLLDARVFAH